MGDKCTLPWVHGFEEGGHSLKLGLMFIRIIQRNRTNRLIIYLLIYGEELTHIIRKAENFHAVSSASCKPRKASGSIPSQLNSLGSSVAGGANTSLRANENQNMCPSSDSRSEEKAITPSFSLFGTFKVWVVPNCVGEASLFSWFYHLKC